MSKPRRTPGPGEHRPAEGTVRPVRCHACQAFARIDASTGNIEASDGSRGRITYADHVAVIWDCPSCGYPHAEDLGR